MTPNPHPPTETVAGRQPRRMGLPSRARAVIVADRRANTLGVTGLAALPPGDVDTGRYGWLAKTTLTQAQLLKLTAIAILRVGLNPSGREPEPYALALAAELGWTDPTDGEGSGTGE